MNRIKTPSAHGRRIHNIGAMLEDCPRKFLRHLVEVTEASSLLRFHGTSELECEHFT